MQECVIMHDIISAKYSIRFKKVFKKKKKIQNFVMKKYFVF